jgi:phosphatidylinositol-3,4,5-trisphosphate 3-phosphatase/dual-specificity protein phosphatase PTEN
MISCFLLYSRFYNDPNDAIEYFNTKRCVDGRGVTIPSQKRYVEYFADYLLNKRIYLPVVLNLVSLEIYAPKDCEVPKSIKDSLIFV